MKDGSSEINCLWHNGDEPIGDDEVVGCASCGRMIATKECNHCHEEFIDWNYKYSDDLVVPPGVTASGDFMCRSCARRHDEEEERMFEEDAADYFPDPYE